MNNFYTLHSLVKELRYNLSGIQITEVWSHRKDQIDLYLHPPESGKLTFSASSPGTAIFRDNRAGKPSRNAAEFFPEIHGKTISGIEMASLNDRYVRIDFRDDDHVLLFMPFSSRPNLFLVRNNTIVAAFKNPAGWAGTPAPVPQSTAEKKEINRSKKETEKNSDVPGSDFKSLQKSIISIDKQFPRGIIRDVIDTLELQNASIEKRKEIITGLKQQLLHPEKVYITAEGNLSLLPEKYLSHPPERIFDSVNDAVRTLFLSQNKERRLLPRKNDLIKKLEKRIAGLEKQQAQLNKNPERLKKAQTYEHYGNLLMSHPQPKSAAPEGDVPVQDWENEGREIVIPVKKGRSIMDQAQAYYEKAADIRRDVEVSGSKKTQLARRKKEMEERLLELKAIAHPSELEKWLTNHKSRLQDIGLVAAAKQPEARPYRSVSLGKYDVWIGKSAKNNDDMLTLSHKEDIWMHVRGASGSHVIIRNAGTPGWPDNTILQRVASFAAAFSKLSGSSLVPVMIAKRKHVRKPKGAAPGQVTVTNERVEMVKPQKPDLPDS